MRLLARSRTLVKEHVKCEARNYVNMRKHEAYIPLASECQENEWLSNDVFSMYFRKLEEKTAVVAIPYREKTWTFS